MTQKTPTDWSPNPSAEVNYDAYDSTTDAYDSSTDNYDAVIATDLADSEEVPTAWSKLQMATDFPGAIDGSSKLPNPATTDKRNSPSHAGLHDNTNDAVKATQTKVGTGASTPAANTLLFGTGAGTSAWTALTSAQLLAALSDETGTGSAVFANTPVLITPKVDTINENTTNNGVTVGGVSLKAGVISTSLSVPTAAIQAGAVGSAQLAAGVVVQVVGTNFSALATGTTVIPFDDTIPQSTEGDQYMTQAITPKATTNVLYIEVTAFLASSIATNMQGALFQDSTANALTAIDHYQATSGGPVSLKINYTMIAGTTSATTFKLRAGADGVGTTTFNGTGGARRYGGVAGSSMKITEVKV